MIINMTGGGGGGLNLKVVGGTSRPGGSDTLTWDGNTEGLESVEALGLYKISDATPTLDELRQGGKLVVYINGNSGEVPLSVDNMQEVAEGVIMFTNNGFVVHEQAVGVDFDGAVFPKSGIYIGVAGIERAEIQFYGYTFGGSSVKDNTIWVNTDTAINGYAFSADEPASPVEGIVWFQTGTVSGAAMNVDKKNMVMIYPNSCSQYISGEWVSKTAKTYLDGAWKDWKKYLYRAGDTDTGFVALGWIFGSGATARAPTIDYGADSVVFTATTEGQYGGRSGVAYFPNKVDLSQYSTLTADATLAGSIQEGHRPEGLYIWSEVGTGTYVSSAVASALFNGLGDKILTIDVSELSGEHYIGFGLRYESTPAETITLREVALE